MYPRYAIYCIYCCTLLSFDLGLAQQSPSNSCHRFLLPYYSASCLLILSIYPYASSPGRCCSSRHHSISCSTFLSFDLRPARQWPSNSCHRVFALHSPTFRLRTLSMYQYEPSPGQFWRPRHYAILCNTVFSFAL
jgi:hypothetical protein